jgi:gamma-glutamylcyclotransferase (GGCT)/AIG2-like uncharacterized protein YtfP
MKVKLFVYGTLKRGYGLNRYLKTSDFLGVEVVEGFTLYSNGGFPYMVKGDGVVYGEVYEVSDKDVMDILDVIEGAYRRENIKDDVQAYVYYGSTEGLAHIGEKFV